MSDGLNGRVALVIGGAHGMGLASCKALAAKGAAVVIADRDIEAAEEAAETLRREGGKSLARRVDATSLPELKSVVEAVGAEYGKLNILFSNVGTRCGDGFDVTEEEFQTAFDINLKSHYFLTTYALPFMRPCAPHASIIYMASAGALRYSGRSPLYSISKASLVMMTRAFARQLGPEGVRVNALCPGGVETAFSQRGMDDDAYRAKSQEYAQQIPLRRIGKPEDISGVVAFLASDEAAYMTGLALPIDGGALA